MKKLALALTLLCAFGLLPAALLTAQDAPLFHVVTDNTLNLRACPGTDCERVGQVAGGTELPVHAIRDAWYQVLVDGEPVWLAGWLTTRAPAADPTPTRAKLLTMGETWTDSATGCNLLVGRVAGEAGDLALLLAGEGRREVRVDVYMPGAAAALPLAESRESLADVMGNPVIIRVWPEFPRWPAGRYRFELGLGELGNVFEWEMPGPGEYSLLIDCERPASSAAPVPGDAPARMLVTGEITRDRETGCNLYMTAGEGEAGLDILLIGERRREARVDLFLPGEDTALLPELEKVEEQPDEGEAYVARFYSRDLDWRPGLYRIELEPGERSGVFTWEMERPGKYALLVDCDGSPPGAPVRGDAPPQLFLTGERYRDRGETGCNLFLSEGEGQGGVEIVFIGEQRREARVDLFLPDDNMALQPEPDRKYGQFDDGVAYIAQEYASDLDWRSGLYRLELTLGERSSAFVWHMERLGRYFLFVDCDAPSPGESGSAQGPVMLEPEVIYRDPVTGCTVFLLPDSPDDDLNLLIDGERHAEVAARVYRPDASRPLTADGRLDRVHADSGRPYFLQYYSAERDWPAGIYRLELELEGRVSEFAWHMEAPRDQTLHARCDQDAPEREAADVTADPTPTPARAPQTEAIDQDVPLFRVVTDNVLNLRACGNTDCARVGQAPGGTELPVFAVEGDWYQVLVDGELVWAAGWLMTRAPDMVLEDTSMTLDEATGCVILLGARELFDVLHIMVGGDLYEDVRFEFYLPGEDAPLGYSDRSLVAPDDPDSIMIEHVYQGVQVVAGRPYRLLIEAGGASSLLEWYPGQSGGTAIFIICNDPEGIGSGSGPGPISSGATPLAQVATAVPARGSTPTRTPDEVLRGRSIYLDYVSNCVVLPGVAGLYDDLTVLLGGDLLDELGFALYPPGESGSLAASGRSTIDVPEAGAMTRLEYRGVRVEAGRPWLLHIELQDRDRLLQWYPEDAGETSVFIICNPLEYPASDSEAGPVSSLATVVAQVGALESSGDGATPAPPIILEIGDTHRDPETGCLVRLAPESPGQDFDVVLSGARRADVEVRVYRPGAERPLPFTGRVERVLVEGEPRVIQQNYSADQDWPWGLYRLEVELDGRVSAYALRMEAPTDQFFLVLCEESRSAAPLAAAPTPAPEPTPPRVLETGVIYRDDHSGCDIIIDAEGLDGDLNLALAGDRYADIEARVYRPGSDVALRYSDRLEDAFAESDKPFIWQYYSVTTPWSDGQYRLEVTLDGRTTQALWNLERGGDQLIYIFCNTAENQLPVASLTPTPTPTATVTPSPTATATPRPTRTPVPTRSRELRAGRDLRDFHTGCVVQVSPEGLDGHFHLVLTGDRREEVAVAVYHPGESIPVDYTRRRHETFDDSDERFVWLQYRNFGGWPPGLYRLDMYLDGRSSELFWNLERGGDQVIYIDCDGPVPRPTATPRVTPTPSPTPTPVPTPTPIPTPTPVEPEADIRTGALYLDEATGCSVLVLELPPEQADWKDLWINRGGEGQQDVEVDVWLPGAEAPLLVEEVYEERLDAGELMVVQSYSPRTDWRNGLYRIDLRLNDDASSLTWRMEGPGYYPIQVSCGRAAGPAPSV